MTPFGYECRPLGDSGLVLQLGTSIEVSLLKQIRQLAVYLEKNRFEGFIELVTAYTTITIFYDSMLVYSYNLAQNARVKARRNGITNALLPYDIVLQHIETIMAQYVRQENESQMSELGNIVEIPVCYGGSYGPDLPDVAAYHQVSPEEIVRLHTACVYPVYMIGFAPGFPYLGGLSERLATPRKSEPRTKIPAGSVGIGGAQTGIYPFETPGGWNLIGCTPLALFRPDAHPPSLLEAGDRVRFVAISSEQFEQLRERKQDDGL
ncbi:5-oxoprolinase subunit PxpB [Paenibacillus alba]|uniref:5-oxoprolinase subunit PxpB n=1 Tax=Paenibacillus alba TaxID=1197127 RepID=UPI00156335B9|nr:5-oxoprolinase subunit PxpB [Paenibacillus alba]NQX71844.1 5-oxoprolinase subunit PxpB [Paenibacillus alba]